MTRRRRRPGWGVVAGPGGGLGGGPRRRASQCGGEGPGPASRPERGRHRTVAPVAVPPHV